MSSKKIIPVAFSSDLLQLVNVHGVPYVAIKPIVKALKLNWAGQQAKLLEEKEKFSYMVIHTTGSDGKQYKMGCIPLKKVNGWLFAINPNKIPDQNTKQEVIQYQEECFEALWNHLKTSVLTSVFL